MISQRRIVYIRAVECPSLFLICCDRQGYQQFLPIERVYRCDDEGKISVYSGYFLATGDILEARISERKCLQV